MPLLNYQDLIALYGKFEKSYYVIFHKLGRNRPTNQSRKFRLTAGNILSRLHWRKLVGTTLGLYGNYKVSAISIQTDVNLIDFDLPHASNLRTQVILQGICGQTEENIDEAVVSHLS